MAEPPDSVVLLVTRNLPPLVGGMEKLNLNVALELDRELDLMVVGPTGFTSYLPSIRTAAEVPHKPLWKFLSAALLKSLVIARKYRPGCIVAGSGLTAPIILLAARLCGARTAAYTHGLDLVAPYPIYRRLWLPFLRRMDLCIANSRNTAELAVSMGIPKERISVLHPGVDFPPREDRQAASEFRRGQHLDSKKILLSVGRMTARKGLLEFVQSALPAVVDACPGATLVIIGDEAPDALSGGAVGMGQRIADVARRKGLEENVRLLGSCDESVLAAAYQAADVLVFPLRDTPGDVEGFGMVAIEAASFGLPTVAFSVGGVGDAVENGRSGWLAPSADYPAFARHVIQVLADGGSEAMQRQCREFAESFAWTRFGERLRSLINGLQAPARSA